MIITHHIVGQAISNKSLVNRKKLEIFVRRESRDCRNIPILGEKVKTFLCGVEQTFFLNVPRENRRNISTFGREIPNISELRRSKLNTFSWFEKVEIYQKLVEKVETYRNLV